jgi:hypothetical protein
VFFRRRIRGTAHRTILAFATAQPTRATYA